MISFIHRNRQKHLRNMRQAEDLAARAMFLRDNGDPAMGWSLVVDLIELVVDCRCDRELWPAKVRELTPP